MDSGYHWRYRTSGTEYERLRYEVTMESVFRRRDGESYYAYMGRMEMVVERAAELRDYARSQWISEDRAMYRGVGVDRDIPSSSTRPPITHDFPHYPRHYNLNPARASSSRGPYRAISPRPPPGPVRIGSPIRGVTRGRVMRERSRSPSPYYTPSVCSPKGYLSVMTDSEDDHTTVSARSGYMMRLPVVRDEGGSVGDDTSVGAIGEEVPSMTEGNIEGVVETVEVISSAEEPNEGVARGSQEQASSEVEVWGPESPIHEVVVVSSGAETEGDVAGVSDQAVDPEEDPEEEPEEDLSELERYYGRSDGSEV